MAIHIQKGSVGKQTLVIQKLICTFRQAKNKLSYFDCCWPKHRNSSDMPSAHRKLLLLQFLYRLNRPPPPIHLIVAFGQRWPTCRCYLHTESVGVKQSNITAKLVGRVYIKKRKKRLRKIRYCRCQHVYQRYKLIIDVSVGLIARRFWRVSTLPACHKSFFR